MYSMLLLSIESKTIVKHSITDIANYTTTGFEGLRRMKGASPEIVFPV